MKNRFYLQTRESKSERFSPYHAYEVYGDMIERGM